MASGTQKTTLDAKEIGHFDEFSATWWQEGGPYAVLHQITPLRIQFIVETTAGLARNATPFKPLAGLTVLDIGCGGGLVSEPLARLGATVTGIDGSALNIETAKAHAAGQGLDITYLNTTAEALASEGQMFHIVIAYEVIEHVANVDLFLASCQQLVTEEGALIVSTLNQTIASYALAIVAAERLLRWVPKGTHSFQKFLRPRALQRHLFSLGFMHQSYRGLSFSPFKRAWKFSDDLDVNYFVAAFRHKKGMGIQHFEGELCSWG